MRITRIISGAASVVLLSLSLKAGAAQEATSLNLIERIVSYGSYGNGDFFVSLTTNASPTCSYGFYISKDHPGYESTVSMLLSAYHSKTKVKISGENDKVWPGSSGGHVCKIYSVEY